VIVVKIKKIGHFASSKIGSYCFNKLHLNKSSLMIYTLIIVIMPNWLNHNYCLNGTILMPMMASISGRFKWFVQEKLINFRRKVEFVQICENRN